MDEDISRLKTTAVSLLSDLGCNGSTLTEDLINEMCRFGAAKLHACKFVLLVILVVEDETIEPFLTTFSRAFGNILVGAKTKLDLLLTLSF